MSDQPDIRTLEKQLAHCDGKDCQCYACGKQECVCDVDWTPAEVYRLRSERDALRKEAASWKDMYHAERKRIEVATTIVRDGQRVALVLLEDGE